MSNVYCLPGYAGSLATGLGAAIASRGFTVTGRETKGEFQRLSFHEQVSTVAEDMQRSHWQTDALLIANSFGGYLFLHAQAMLPPYPGKALLISLIVGSFQDTVTRMGFIPPRSDYLFKAASSGLFPKLDRAEIHVGSDDWQCNPDQVKQFGELTGIRVVIVPGGGHRLDKDYVGGVLDEWLLR